MEGHTRDRRGNSATKRSTRARATCIVGIKPDQPRFLIGEDMSDEKKTDQEFIAECEALIEANHGTSQTPMLTEAIERLKRVRTEFEQYKEEIRWDAIERDEMRDLYKGTDK